MLKQVLNEAAAFALLIIDNIVFLQIHKYREPQVFLYQEVSYSIWHIADERFKEQEASVDLRRQLKDLLEENAKLKTELSESKREIFKLQQKR